tara:strand:+ start:102 stop:698 length:597 start_codon:yes stop_codon:yes gene_type:complete
MNISKFLLIDAALAIAIIPLFYLIKGKTKEDLLEKININLPDREKLLYLEKISMGEGYNIEFEWLVGIWKFVSIWEKDTEDKVSIFSTLLRIFSAKIEIKKEISPQNPLGFSISTSIHFGFLSIKFSGPGYLKAKQPLLIYFFNLIEFKSGSNVLLRRSIKEPIEKLKPFFAIIASNEIDKWLSARGHGGALILWLKE